MFAKRLKSLRIEKDITQNELAKVLNVSRSTLGKWENGTSTPNYSTLSTIASFFNVSIDYLLGQSNSKVIEVPEKFTTAEEAAQFLLDQQAVMAYGDFDTNKLSDDEKIQFANELLQQLKLLGYKYKK